VAKARPSARLNSNQGTKSNMEMRPRDLGSVENGSPQRLLGLRQVNRFAVARDALEGDSGWASTSKSCAPRGRRSRTRATAVVDGPLDRHTLIDDALVRRADPPTKRPRKRNTVTLNSEKTRTPPIPVSGWPLRKAVGPEAAVSRQICPLTLWMPAGGFLFGECATTKLLNLGTT
jgi:hypothetical protein